MTSPTKLPRYSRETWLKARDAWDAGRFDTAEWAEWRLLAQRAGIIFPPDGTAHDSWDADSPSQRAMLIRAIRETPRLLRAAITKPGVHSWGDVVARLLLWRDRRLEDVERREADWEAVKDRRRGGATRIGDVLTTIGDSLGVDR